MGIRGVWTLFRDLFHKIDPLDPEIKPLKIGIDMFSLIYTHRAQLHDLIHLLVSWSQKGHVLTCVWDGTAPDDKKDVIGQRRSTRESAISTKKDLEKYLEMYQSELTEQDIRHLKKAIGSLEWQGWHLTSAHKREIKEQLGPTIKNIVAEGEADDILIQLEHSKEIDVVVTLDSDLFAMGCPRIWRILSVKKQWLLEEICIEDICANWKISLNNLQDSCFLAGWDRCHLKGLVPMSFESAIHRMKQYGSMHHILEKFCGDLIVDEESFSRLKNLKEDSKARWIERRSTLSLR
jgi:5'-3' exonuclease